MIGISFGATQAYMVKMAVSARENAQVWQTIRVLISGRQAEAVPNFS